jgi:polysaccharide deacetylase 2 family uncharacterized protein YibQ
LKKTSKRKPPLTSKRRVSASGKSYKRPAVRKPPVSRKKKRKPTLSPLQLAFILAGFALLIAAVSFGILYFKGEKNACRSGKKAISMLVLGTLFQEGLSRDEVSWHKKGGLIVYNVRSKSVRPRVYKRLKKRVPAQFPGAHVNLRKGRIVLLCGKTVSHEILFYSEPTEIKRHVTKSRIKRGRRKKSEIPEQPKKLVVPEKKAEKVRIAIVIDDIGNDRVIARELMNLPVPVTLSIFPYAPYAQEIAKEAEARHYPIMMHIPMEPEGYPAEEKDPGPGALLVQMSSSDLKHRIEMDLDRIPSVSGVNNHMGSRFTCDPEAMKVLVDELKKRKKFFLDSRTSALTVGFNIARQKGLPAIQRDVFLDNTLDVKKIRHQLNILVEKAKKNGYAVGIGHPHRATYLALKKAIPELEKEGVSFVFVSALVH